MRILHVVPTYVPAWRYGGPIRSVHGLCKALSTAGHEVEVYTTNVDGAGELDVPVSTPVEVEGVKVWYFPSKRLRRLYWSPAMGEALKRSVRSFDLIHLHSIYLWPTLAGARAARRAGVPYVISPRGMLLSSLIRGKSRWIKTLWIHMLERKNIAHAAAAHFTSRNEEAEARKLGISFRRALVVPNGSEAEGVASDRSIEDAADLAGLGRGFILFIGRISWEKGLDRLVAALQFVPGSTLVVAGDCAQVPLKAKLEAIATQAGVLDRIRFIGPVHGGRKAYLLKNAAVLILPSYSESFGNVVLEAMAAGCPVVVTPEVGAAEIVNDTGAGMVISGDPKQLGEGIRKLLASPERLASMGMRGRAAFEEKFTWPSVAKQMLQGYLEIIESAALAAGKESHGE